MSRRFVWPSLERARNAVVSLWSRLEAYTPFGMHRADLDELRERLKQANRHVAECESLVGSWEELMQRRAAERQDVALSRDMLKIFSADLEAATKEKMRAEKLLNKRLRELFIGAKGRRPKTDEELDAWLASAEGKAATAFEPTSLPSSRDSSRRS